MTQRVLFVAPARSGAEERAAWAWLRTAGFEAVRATGSAVVARLDGAAAVWWHAAGLDRPALADRDAHALRSWIEQGGRLWLSLRAAALLHRLGLEERWPDDEGTRPWRHGDAELAALEGERRGWLGFGPHPIFGGVHHGAFLLEPRPGRRYPEAVYRRPVRGLIVAAEWQYLTVSAERCVVLEHRLGDGLVLTAGAHLLFGPPADPNRPILESVARNCLDYVLAGAPAAERCFWPASSPPRLDAPFGGHPRPVPPAIEPSPAKGGAAPASQPPPAGTAEGLRLRKHETLAGSPFLISSGGADQQFDVAGRTILAIGRERAGIVEVWAPPVRLARDVAARFPDGQGEAATLAQVYILPGQIRRVLRPAGATVLQTVTAAADEVTVAYEVLAGAMDYLQVGWDADLRYFWPYPAGVLGRCSVRADAGGLLLVDGDGHTRASVTFDPPGPHVEVQTLPDGAPRLTATFASPGHAAVRFSAPRAGAGSGGEIQEPMLRVETPDAIFDTDFFWTSAGLRAFDAESPVGRGLLAGLAETGTGWWSGRPGYAWYFGRDTLWSLPACLGLGLRQPAREALRLLARYQRHDGKIVHELTPAGAAHFDAADSTPLFLWGLACYLRWSGDLGLVRELWPAAEAARRFAAASDKDGDGLIENTGVGHGWSEGGRFYGAHATFYLNACWAAGLSAMAYLARAVQQPELALECDRQAERVRLVLNTRFYSAAHGWFAFGIDRQGRIMPLATMEPAVAALHGLLEAALTSRFFDGLASERYTTPWGVRYVARDDAGYNPRGYHSGSVWPLFTGWAAWAEYTYGRPAAALSHLRSSLALVRRGALGAIDEVLDGDTGQPAGVCPRQLWSHAMTVTPVIEGLLGIRPDALAERLVLRPQLPSAWPWVRVRGLRVGNETLSFTYRRRPSGIEALFDSPPRMEVDLRLPGAS